MKLAIYGLIYIIGTLFGSFFSLAVYRIPIKQSIMKGRSYCPNCNHKLGFFDLIPVFSYIFLGGKCRYCKKKIRIRYICLEILSGLVFLVFTISLKINILDFDLFKLVYLILGMLFISTLFLIGGIEKENHYVSKSVLLFGLIGEAIYIIYLYILKVNIYKYAIYLLVMCVLIIANAVLLKKNKKEIYTLQILILCMYILIFVKEELFLLTAILTLVLVIVDRIKNRMNNKKKNTNSLLKNSNKSVPIGFYLCALNIVMIAIQNFIY